MNIIDHFETQIPVAVGDNHVLQVYFLHRLFPDTYDLEECKREREVLSGQRSYKLVGADGFALAAGVEGRFEKGMDWLCGIDFPKELYAHGIALLGIAIGIQVQKKPAWMVWWDKCLAQLGGTAETQPLAHLLAVVSGRQAPLSVHGSLDELELVQGLFAHPPQWDKEVLAKYFTYMRKRTFPYYEDFFRLMLAVYLMDHAMTHAMKSSAELAEMKRKAAQEYLSQTEHALAAFADRSARRIVVALAVITVIVNLAACTLLFVGYDHAPVLRNFWDVTKWITLWLSGPVAALTWILRILTFALRRQPITLDLQTWHAYFLKLLISRWRHRLKLDLFPTHNP
jgi:hypothetical protein